MLLATEYSWLKFPSTTLSSSILLGVNGLLLAALFAGRGRPSRQIMRVALLIGTVAVPVGYMLTPGLVQGDLLPK